MSNTYQQILRGLFLLGFVFAILAMFQYQEPEKKEIVLFENNPQGFFINPFDTLTLEAKAVYVYDIVNKEVIYEIDSEQQLPLASLTKLMTVLIANEKLDSEDQIIITEKDISQEGDIGLLAGETWEFKNLANLALVASSNDAAYAISNSNGDFISLMNKRAKELGLTQSYFTNSTGLDRSLNTSGSYGSAHDIALLISYISTESPELIETTQKESVSLTSIEGNILEIKNTNKIINEIPGIISSKTGFTDLSGGNLAVVFDAGLNRPIAVVVLGSTFEGRFEDVKSLAWASLRHLQKTE